MLEQSCGGFGQQIHLTTILAGLSVTTGEKLFTYMRWANHVTTANYFNFNKKKSFVHMIKHKVFKFNTFSCIQSYLGAAHVQLVPDFPVILFTLAE